MIQSLLIGTHIRTSSQPSHHGIYVGNFTVAELVPPNLGGTARYRTFAEFLRGRSFYVVDHPNGLDLDAVAARAHWAIGRLDYDLLSFNCEHFANWCATGVARSHQVESAKKVVTAVACAGVALLAAFFLWPRDERLA